MAAVPVTDEPFRILMESCSNLQQLTLDDCRELTTIRLCSPHMKSIIMPRCRHLSTLALDCPALQSLDITGCVHLTSFSLGDSWHSLTSLKAEYCPEFVFAALPVEIRERLHPRRGVRTERGGVEASVRAHGPIVSVAAAAGGASGGDSAPTGPQPQQDFQTAPELAVLEWRIQRLEERLADPALTTTSRFGIQRQLQVQKAARTRELRRLAAVAVSYPASDSAGPAPEDAPTE